MRFHSNRSSSITQIITRKQAKEAPEELKFDVYLATVGFERWSCIDLMGEMISDAFLADLFTIVIKVCILQSSLVSTNTPFAFVKLSSRA